MMPRTGKQSGFAIVSSIMLIVLLALLGVFMATLSGVQHETASRSLVATRVYYGAKAGIDWGVHRAIGAGGICLSSTTFTFPVTDTVLDGITVTVTCVTTYVTATDKTYYIESLAEFRTYGSPDYTRRRIGATVANF